MHLKHTFHGPFNRVQLEVFDFTGEFAEPRTISRLSFYVAGLPQEAHSACTFRVGANHPATRLYAGDSFTEAWDKVREITSRPQKVPKKFARYLR